MTMKFKMTRILRRTIVGVFTAGVSLLVIRVSMVRLTGPHEPSRGRGPSDNLGQRPCADSDVTCRGSTWGQHRLAVIVPFLRHYDELAEGVPKMHKYLLSHKVRHRFYVMKQSAGPLRFNRGLLVNAGYEVSRGECDYLVIHDVTLVPRRSAPSLRFPLQHVLVIPTDEKQTTNYFNGGLVLVKHAAFKKVNGLSTRFWGSDGDVKEFLSRARRADLDVGWLRFSDIPNRPFDRLRPQGDQYDNRPASFSAAIYGNHSDPIRIQTSDGSFTLGNSWRLPLGGADVVFHEVALRCYTAVTPWCLYTNRSDWTRDYAVSLQ